MSLTVPNGGSATSIELAHMPTSTVIADNAKINLTARENEQALQHEETERGALSTRITAIVIACVTFSTGIQSFLAGLVTIAIPTMAVDLSLPDNLVLWWVYEHGVYIYRLLCRN